MSEITRRLHDAGRNGGVPAMVGRAAALLADVDFLRDQTADPEERIAEARRAFAALEGEAEGAWRRYPAVAGAGFHSGPPDLRPLLLTWAVRQVRDAGFYTADEIERLGTTGEATPAWIAAEALRLNAFLVTLRALTDDFLARRMPAPEYTAAVKELAFRFSRMEVLRTPSRR